tara:strand:- start:526 stop:813 length:288 start_codon:yes stop_codon:yes gene_type:complete
MMKIYLEIVKIGLIGLATFLSIGLLLSIPLCLLWNWLMPDIFGLPTINVLQAFGLSAIVTFLSPTNLDLKNKKQKVDVDKHLERAFKDITSQFTA